MASRFHTTVAYDAHGTATSITGPYGAQSLLTTLANGYLGAITDPLSRKVSFTYTEGGLLETLTEPDNGQAGVHKFTYDTLGRLLKDESAGGFAQTLSRKTIAAGVEVALSTPLGRTRIHRKEPGSNGQLTRTVVQRDGTQLVTAITPGKNTITTPTSSVTQTLIGDPRFGLQAPIVSAVDLKSETLSSLAVTNSRVETQTDSTDPTSLTHLTDKLSINGRITTTDFDVTTRTATVTSPLGRKAVSTWDSAGRIVSAQSGGLAAQNIEYDERGRLAKFTVGDRVTQFTYGTNGYLGSVTNALGQTTSFTTDAVGRRTGTLLPDLATLSFGYDTHDNNQSVTNASSGVHQFAFAADDLVASYTTPVAGSGNLTTTFGYDADQQLTRVTLPDTTNLHLSYDSAKGRLTSTSLRGTEGQVALTYDDKTGQLKSEAFAGETGTPRTTASSSRASHTTGPSREASALATTRTTGSRPSKSGHRRVRLFLMTMTAYSRKLAARHSRAMQITAGTTAYRYNSLGTLTGVTLANGTKTDYRLDSASRRLSKAVNGTVSRDWLYRDAQRPAAELDASGKVTSLFVYGTHALTPEYLIQGSRTYKVIADWRGSVRLVVDASTGEVAQRIDYDAYGQVTTDSNPGFQPFGFAGGLYDPDTKLVRFGARDYMAALSQARYRRNGCYKAGARDWQASPMGSKVN